MVCDQWYREVQPPLRVCSPGEIFLLLHCVFVADAVVMLAVFTADAADVICAVAVVDFCCTGIAAAAADDDDDNDDGDNGSVGGDRGFAFTRAVAGGVDSRWKIVRVPPPKVTD